MTAVTSATQLNAHSAHTQIKSFSRGTGKFMIVDVVMSAAYATGGDTIDFGSSFGPVGTQTTSTGGQPVAVFCQAIGPTAAGYLATYDLTNKKLMLFRQSAATGALTEPNGIDTHTTTVRCLVFF